jgi:hypothetical protein
LSDLSKQLLLGGYNNVKKEKTEYCRKEEKWIMLQNLKIISLSFDTFLINDIFFLFI